MENNKNKIVEEKNSRKEKMKNHIDNLKKYVKNVYENIQNKIKKISKNKYVNKTYESLISFLKKINLNKVGKIMRRILKITITSIYISIFLSIIFVGIFLYEPVKTYNKIENFLDNRVIKYEDIKAINYEDFSKSYLNETFISKENTIKKYLKSKEFDYVYEDFIIVKFYNSYDCEREVCKVEEIIFSKLNNFIWIYYEDYKEYYKNNKYHKRYRY